MGLKSLKGSLQIVHYRGGRACDTVGVTAGAGL